MTVASFFSQIIILCQYIYTYLFNPFTYTVVVHYVTIYHSKKSPILKVLSRNDGSDAIAPLTATAT